MSDSVRPHRWQSTRLPHPWDSPGKNTGVGCHFLLQCMKVKVKGRLLSRVQPLATPWTPAFPAPPSMGFSRQEYWSGVPLSTPLLLHISFLFSLSFSSKALTAGAGIVSYFDHRDAPLRLYLWVIRNHVSWSPGLHVASTFTKFNGYPSTSVNKNSFGFFL